MLKREKVILYADKALYWLLIFIPFSGIIASGIINSLLGFAIVAYLVKKIASKDYWPQKSPISTPFLFLMLVSLISMFNTIDFASSIKGMEKLLKYGFTFIIYYEAVKDVRHAQRIIFSLACGVFLISLDAVFQLQSGRDFIRHQVYDVAAGLPRLKATLPHTNLFGLYLGLVLPLIFSLGRYFLKNSKKLFFTLTFILGTFCIIFTFSRGAVIGFFFALILIAIIKKDKTAIVFITVLMFISPFLLPGSIKDWVKDRRSVAEMMLNAERIYIYKTAFNMISRHPFFGVGVNTFSENYKSYKINQVYGNTGESQYYGHNNFLHMAGEIGLIGLGVFLWLLFILFRKWYIIYKSLPAGTFLKICNLGLIAGIISFLINGMTETGLYYSKIATLFWVHIGVLLAVLKVSQNHIKEESR